MPTSTSVWRSCWVPLGAGVGALGRALPLFALPLLVVAAVLLGAWLSTRRKGERPGA